MVQIIRTTTDRLFVASDPAPDGVSPLSIGQIRAWVTALDAEGVADGVPMQYALPDGRLTLFVEILSTHPTAQTALAAADAAALVDAAVRSEVAAAKGKAKAAKT